MQRCDTMSWKDPLYGEVLIENHVILALLESPALQRLRGVDQTGYEPLYIKKRKVNRLEHSIGVYLLLRLFGASIEEQIMGLIHDISHACFSHCIDYVLKSGSEENQSLQDDVFDSFVRNSEIKDIIEEYGFDIDYILNKKNFPLLEKDLPSLCADRIDYSLRDALSCEVISVQQKDEFLENLIVENQNWIFKNLEIAKKYANMFAEMNERYSGISAAIMFRVVGDFLKHSLEKGYITEEDLYTTDDFVIQKIKQLGKGDKVLEQYWERMNNKMNVVLDPIDGVVVFCKSRIVNPLFKENGQLKRVSDVDEEWKVFLKRESKPKKYSLSFL